MQATRTIAEHPQAELSAETAETAAKLGAMFRYLFTNDGGAQLRAIEDSGLGLSQCKALLLLGELDGDAEPSPLHELASRLGLSITSASRAVDGLVRKRMVTRVEDKQDRRVRRVAITAKGREVVAEIVAARMAGLERFAATLTAAERRKLDTALNALLEREEIARTYEQLKEISR
jgi:DNA-binding MarR family transcriptional regulator